MRREELLLSKRRNPGNLFPDLLLAIPDSSHD
jgi:hypothetical protein